MKRHELIAEHIKRISQRYRDSHKVAKSTILNEFCHTWGLSRKYANRKLLEDPVRFGKRAGRPCTYDGRLALHLTVLWVSMERICPKRMKAALPLWLPFYEDPACDSGLRLQLLKISASQIGRYLDRGRKTLRGLSATRRAKFF